MEESSILAKGSLTPSNETLLQAYRATRKPWTLILVCVGCGMIITSQLVRIGMGVAQILIFDRPIYTAVSMWIAVLCVLFAVFLLVWTVIAPRRYARRRMRQIREMFPTVPKMLARFDADGVSVTDEGTDRGMRFVYPVVKKCFETQDLFVFLTKEKQFFAVEKQTLELFDGSDFHRLIEKLCPKAKRNWRSNA